MLTAGAVSAPLSCFMHISRFTYVSFYSNDYISKEGKLPTLLWKKENIVKDINHNRKTKGQQRVRLRLRAETGVLLPCLVNSEIQSLGPPVPLSEGKYHHVALQNKEMTELFCPQSRTTVITIKN